MADFIFSGGVRFNDTCVANVTMDDTGKPLTCKNPITGDEISGGGGVFGSAAVQFVNETGSSAYLSSSIYVYDADLGAIITMDEIESSQYEPMELLLVNGSYVLEFSLDDTIAVTGAATQDPETGEVTVTGDCTITVTAVGN